MDHETRSRYFARVSGIDIRCSAVFLRRLLAARPGKYHSKMFQQFGDQMREALRRSEEDRQLGLTRARSVQ